VDGGEGEGAAGGEKNRARGRRSKRRKTS